MFYKTLITAILMCLISNLYAQEIYLKENNSSREYIVVEINEGSGFKLKQYSQEKGSYQDLVGDILLANRSDVLREINQNYNTYKLVQELPYWEIEGSKMTSLTLGARRIFGSKKHTSIWYAKNQWNEEWEKEFSNWIQKEVKEDFYTKYNLATDCADAVVALRWIFARINSLPVANHLSDTRTLFGHYSMKKEWSKLSTATNWYDDRLFLAALEYVINLTSTRTIIYDGYPVSLNAQGLVTGTYIVTQNDGGGHVKFISETHFGESKELPFYTLASTVPRKLRLLNKEVMLDQDWPEYGIKDILGFKWPQVINGKWQLADSLDRSNYSMEQYDLSLRVENPIFIEYVFKNLEGNYNPYMMIEVGVEDIIRYLEQRVSVVNQGYIACQSQDCSVDSNGDDVWGTRSRDQKVLAKFNDLDILVKEFSKVHPQLNRAWIKALKDAKLEINDYELSLFAIKYIFSEKMHSSLASDSVDKRWGLNIKETVNLWANEFLELLEKRNSTINNVDYSCGDDCLPRSSLWLSLSTYHIDSSLNKLAVKARNFCHMFGESLCTDILSGANYERKYHGQKKTLAEWMNSVVLFNSDAKATVDSRWGILEQGYTARVLPIHEKEITISKNKIALIDGDVLYDLEGSTVIYKVQAQESLYLNALGQALKVNHLNSTYDLYENGSWKALKSWNDTFKEASNLNITVSDNSFIIKLIDQSDIYIAQGEALDFIGSASGGFKVSEDYIYFPQVNKNVVFYNMLTKHKNVIDFNSLNKLKNPELLEVNSISAERAEIILSYEDKNEDIYTSLHLKLEAPSLESIQNEKLGNYKILWSDPALKKMIVKTHWNREFSKVYLVSWDESSDEAKTLELYNDAYSFNVQGKELIFISSEGGQWDQRPKVRLYKWGSDLTELIENTKGYRPVAHTALGYYFLTETGGAFHDLDNDVLRPTAGAMNFNNDSCRLEKGTESFVSFRFNSSYGDYMCMGGIISANSVPKKSNHLVPVLTIYPWINKEDLVDKHWQLIFNQSIINKGILISNGLNNSYWFDEE